MGRVTKPTHRGHIYLHADASLPSVDSGPPISDLQLGKSLLPGGIATALSCSFLGPLGWGGEREPHRAPRDTRCGVSVFEDSPQAHTCSKVGRDGDGPCSHTEGLAALSPPPVFLPVPLGLGPPPCAVQLSRSAGSCPSTLSSCPRMASSPSRSFQCWGGGWEAPRFPPLYEAPLRQAHYNFCKKHSTSLCVTMSCFTHVGVGDGWVKRAEGGGGRAFVSVGTWSSSLWGGPGIDGRAAPHTSLQSLSHPQVFTLLSGPRI